MLGIDVSAWQGNISADNWATLKRATNQQVNGVYGDGRDFVFIRASRGGTTGYYNQSDPNNVNGQNTLSQRYDDPYFVQNITRATTAGLFAGPYHFARPDIVASTPNSGGIPNNGPDEADHMIQMAGAWMRPGYLLPVLDLEAGMAERSDAQLAAFGIEFAERIYQVMGIRPMIYIGGNYANYIRNQPAIVTAIPNLWTARWPNQADPNSIPVQTAHPKDYTSTVYGPWDDHPNPVHPWRFWQYASTARLNGYANGGANIDVNVAQGGIEFVKDYLVPALWVSSSNGLWTTISNWNSGVTPIAPVQGPGQVPRVGSLTVPTPRLPGANDTVILERTGTNLTITLASGAHNIRKLYAREGLNITGGSLTINYIPSADSTPISAQISAPVTLSGAATLNVHTLQVDATRTFTIGGGTLVFNSIDLMPDSANPARITVTNNINLNPLAGAAATIARGSGSGTSGMIDLGGGVRSLNLANGGADIDLSIEVPISNGGLTKSGLGTMHLVSASTYSGGTTVSAGRLLVNNIAGSATGSGAVVVNGGILGGTGIISGPLTVNSGGALIPGASNAIGRLTVNNSAALNGTMFVRISRTGGSSLADRLALTTGTISYGGSLVVSNTGAALAGGEVFTPFAAPSYAGAFSSTNFPILSEGLNWYLGALTVNGTIRVNRRPSIGTPQFTNEPGRVLQIPIASLLNGASDPDGDQLAVAGINLMTTNGITMVTNSAFISYSNNASVADQFTFTLADGRGGSAIGVVRIVPSPAARFTGYPTTDGQSVSLRFSGRPGWTYYMERSTNLPVWQTISTNVAPSDGVIFFTDHFSDLPAPPPQAFYQLRWSP